MKKPHLVIATDNYLPHYDGIATFLCEIVPRLQPFFTITLIVPGYQQIPPTPHVEIIPIPLTKWKIGDIPVAKFRPRTIRNVLKKADLVFTQTIGSIGITSLLLASRMNKKVVSYVHAVEWEFIAHATNSFIVKKFAPALVRKLVQYVYSKSSLLLTPSDAISERLTWDQIMTSRHIVHLGVDTKQFMPSEKLRVFTRKKLGFRDEEIVIGYHGRIAREKDIPTLVRAYIAVKKKHKNARLLLIGKGHTHLEEQFAKLDGVVMYPAVANVEEYLPAMDIYCLTSLTETTCLSVLEAMSTGLPVIATPVGFIKDYIIHKTNGLLTPVKNSYTLSRKINYLITHPAVRVELGKEARKTVQKDFSWEETAQDILNQLFYLLEDEKKTHKTS